MTNTNCLEGVKCPVCCNEDEFLIQISVIATVADEGVTDSEDPHWDDKSYTRCADCGEEGELVHFRGPGVDVTRALLHALRTVVLDYGHLLDEKMRPVDAAMLRRILGEAITTS
jgi:hypothetical protein